MKKRGSMTGDETSNKNKYNRHEGSPQFRKGRFTGSPMSRKSQSPSPAKYIISDSGNKIYLGREYYENKYNLVQCFIEVNMPELLD